MPASVLTKRPADSRVFAFDFKKYPEIVALDTLAGGQTVTSDGGQPTGGAALTLGAVTISGTQVLVLIGGGTPGILYTLTAQATTAAGRVLTAVGALQVLGA